MKRTFRSKIELVHFYLFVYFIQQNQSVKRGKGWNVVKNEIVYVNSDHVHVKKVLCI